LRAVLDPNVIISAALSPRGSPGLVFKQWLEGAYDLIVSPTLLDELSRALTYPKLSKHIPAHEARHLIELIARAGVITEDPETSSEIASPDPDDDYLIALAATSQSFLIAGDRDLLNLSDRIPVYFPAEFHALLENSA